MSLNIKELHKEILSSIKRGEEMADQKLTEDSQKEKSRHDKAREWAEEVASRVPNMCKEAAAKRLKKTFVVANTPSGRCTSQGDFNSLKNYKSCHFTDLECWNTEKTGLKYYLLHKILIDLGFVVRVEYDYEGGGMYSWHQIVISW